MIASSRRCLAFALLVQGALWLPSPIRAEGSLDSAMAARLPQRLAAARTAQATPPVSSIQPLISSAANSDGGPRTAVLNSWDGIPTDFSLEPPDPSGAAGPNGILATVNLRLEYFDKSGRGIWGPIDHPTFFASVGANGTNLLSDPHTLFDRASGHFYTIVLEVDLGASKSYLDIAVSKTANPLTSSAADWFFYRIEDTETSGGITAWTDYPGMGIDSRAVYVTYNMYTFPLQTGFFTNAVIITLDKAALNSGNTNYNFTYVNGFTLQPCTVMGTNSPGNVAYFAETPLGDRTHVRVWALSDPLGTPSVTTSRLTVPNNGGFPQNFPPQPGTSITIDPVPGRTQGNAFWYNGHIWFCHTAGGSSGKTLVYYYNVSLNGFPGGTPSLTEEGSIDGGSGEFTYQPNIGCNALGDVGIVFCQSSTTRFPTIFATTRKAGASIFDPPALIKASPGYYFGGRWGDFASVTADPTDETFWMTHEYARSTQLGDWGTWWANVVPKIAPILLVTTNYLSGGNGNGMIDPNECNDLFIVVTNVGSLGATNVTATLSSATPGVVIAQRRSLYPDMPIGASGTNAVAFKISTAPSFICGTPVVLSLLIKSDQDTSTNTLQFSTGTNNVPLRFDSFAQVPIPDNNPAGASSPIVVSNFSGAVGNVTVGLFLTHTFDSDLFLELISPDGTTNVLSANNGSSGNNYGLGCSPDSSRTFFDDSASTPIGQGVPPFTGSFRPQQPLSIFIGKSGAGVNGTWNLHVIDQAAFDVGTIQCWSLLLSQPSCTDGGGQCPGVDLSIGMVSAPEPVFVGSNLVYTITITNAGPDTAKNTVISQILPNSVVFVSATASQGSVSQSGGVVTANAGNLAPGATATVTVIVTPTVSALLSSTASVTSSNTDFDPSNNSVTVLSHVNPPFADLAIGLLDAPDPVLVGQTLTYTVSVTNRGPSIASGVTVTNVLPVSVGILGVFPSQGFATTVGNVIVWNLGSLVNGSVAALTIQVNPTLEGNISATSSVTANQTDPLLGNNSATATTTVGPSTDLAIGIVDSPDPVVLRSNLNYTITVTNRGPSVASSVTVIDILPTGVTVI